MAFKLCIHVDLLLFLEVCLKKMSVLALNKCHCQILRNPLPGKIDMYNVDVVMAPWFWCHGYTNFCREIVKII